MNVPKIPHFTDEQLKNFVINDNLAYNRTPLERQLAQVILDDREAFRRLRAWIYPMAKQIFDPPDNAFNAFTRQLAEIDARLPDK